ncbi:MAG TPA: ATP-grasp domain-containing protein [Ktedonobacteraceae bacterium]|nr:ATP-grasp domain-containing protein [Ktedonobacteraceae bacterium]
MITDDISLTKKSPLESASKVYDALVLDAGLRQSLVVVRSLGKRGLRVAALDSSEKLPVPAFSSRWCQHKMICPAPQATKDYLNYLEQALDATGARVLITSSDGTIALVRQYREQLERRVRIALAKEPALAVAVNKEQTLAIAKRLGMGIPRAVTISTVHDVNTALHEIGLPAVVKPVESWNGGRRVISAVVMTADEAKQAVERLTRFGGSVLFQQYLSGRREALSFFHANGEIYARFASWDKRTHPPLGGIVVLREAIAMPEDIGKQAENLVREIGLEGFAQLEFRRDHLGKPYLMEINPRLNAGIACAVNAGIDFPYMLYQWANGEKLTAVKGYRTGGQARYLGGDIMALFTAIQQRGRVEVTPPAQAMRDFFLDFFVPMQYDYCNLSDPLPLWTATSGFTRHILKRVGERFF